MRSVSNDGDGSKEIIIQATSWKLHAEYGFEDAEAEEDVTFALFLEYFLRSMREENLVFDASLLIIIASNDRKYLRILTRVSVDHNGVDSTK